ncbi:MAG: hypothetical protein WHX53_11190, partial [Anaerolineae bacterium]
MIALQLFPDQACEAPEHVLRPAHGLIPSGSGAAVQAQRAVVGLRLPYLPDFLADQTLVGGNDAERLAELLERQVQFVVNLWKWQSAAFSLRYLYRPERAGVEIALLARILARPEAASRAAEELAADLTRLTQTFGLPATPIADREALSAWRTPLSTPFIVEVRQREEVVAFSWAQSEAYVVYPYWRPAGAFLQPFEALLRQGAPCVINLHLEPTRLGEAEYRALAAAAATAQTAADWQRSAHSVEYSGRWADPQAAAVARIYGAQLRRLTQPFVMVAQVASPDRFAAMSIAQTLAAAFAAQAANSRMEDELTSAAEVV